MLENLVLAHGAMGAVALLAGLGAAMAPKRPGLHVLLGRAFAVTFLVSLVLIAGPIAMRANVAMLGLGAVAWFALIEGWRALYRFRGTLPGAPDLVDYGVVGVTALIALGLMAFGLRGLWLTANPLFGVCLAFAALAGVLVRAAVRRWRSEVSKKQWLAVHIGHMTGALGAAITAAAVVNLEGLFGPLQWILWVGPTVIGSLWAQRAMRARGLV